MLHAATHHPRGLWPSELGAPPASGGKGFSNIAAAEHAAQAVQCPVCQGERGAAVEICLQQWSAAPSWTQAARSSLGPGLPQSIAQIFKVACLHTPKQLAELLTQAWDYAVIQITANAHLPLDPLSTHTHTHTHTELLTQAWNYVVTQITANAPVNEVSIREALEDACDNVPTTVLETYSIRQVGPFKESITCCVLLASHTSGSGESGCQLASSSRIAQRCR